MPKNVKIPKKIAGVKLPKKARKTANKAIKLGASPMVRELAVAAIGAAAAKAGDRAPRREARSGAAGAHIQVELGEVGEVLREAALDGLRRFLEGFEEGMRNLAARDRDDEDEEEEEEERPGPRAARASRPGVDRS